MRRIELALAVVISALVSTAAEAQVSIDVTKITCDQYVHSKISTPNYIAAWLSGYYHAKHNETALDVQDLQNKINRLQEYCYVDSNFSKPVMSAIEQLFGKK